MRVTVLLCLCIHAMGCGLTGGQVAAPVDTETVSLTVDPVSRWRALRLEGTTDLPDGAIVSYRVTHSLATELPPGEWPAQNLIADGTAVVRDGQYWAELNTTYWPAGDVHVRVQFPVAPQPDPIRARYGDFGERLAGENVTGLGRSQVVTAEQTLAWSR